MNEKPKDGIYRFKRGDTLPEWLTISGAIYEEDNAEIKVQNGIIEVRPLNSKETAEILGSVQEKGEQ